MTRSNSTTASPTLSILSESHTQSTTDTSSLNEHHEQEFAERSAAYDFRSDFVTIPTPSMLNSAVDPSLYDDAEEDATTKNLQKFMAELTGHEEALLVLSGTMGNQLCLKSALGVPPHSVLVDYRGHIVTMEAGAVSSLTGTMVKTVIPSNRHHLTLEDVKRNAVLTTAIYDCPTRLIDLENTLNGTILPLKDIQEISAWARSQDPPIHIHLDGARLWEAVASGAGSLKDYCKTADSVSLCFTKGLGAPLGSIILGSHNFIRRARVIRKLMGGGMRQSSLIAAPARVAVEEIFLGGKLRLCHERASQLARSWESMGGKLLYPVETNMIWLDLESLGLSNEDFYRMAKEEGIKTMMRGRLVIHHQICQDALARVMSLFKRLQEESTINYLPLIDKMIPLNDVR